MTVSFREGSWGDIRIEGGFFTIAAADGTFEATFPLPVVKSTDDPSRSLEETNIWASDILRGASPSDRAFSAIAIDAAGNTSEMSVRRQVD